MKINRSLKTLMAAGALSLTALAAGAGDVSALGADIAGDRISWYSSLPCYDGGSVDVYARASYRTPSAGYYRLRMGLYTSADARLQLGPIRDTPYVGANTTQAFTTWSTWSSYTGNAEVVAFVYKWNGSAWALVARETVPCL